MSDEDRPEVFRGHIDECLRKFSVALQYYAPRHTAQSAEVKQAIASFCGAGKSSVERWLNAESVPKGDVIFKLMCFLDRQGYRVIELERLSKTKRSFVELVGFGILTLNQIAEQTGYTRGAKVAEIFHGKENFSKERELQLWEVWKPHREDIERRKQEVKQLFTGAPEVGQETLQKSRVSRGKISVSLDERIVIGAIGLLLQLLEHVPPDKMICMIGGNSQDSVRSVLQLSARLNMISSSLISADGSSKGGEEDGE